MRAMLNSEPTNWRAGCGKSASPVRREGRGQSLVPTPIHASEDEYDEIPEPRPEIFTTPGLKWKNVEKSGNTWNGGREEKSILPNGKFGILHKRIEVR